MASQIDITKPVQGAATTLSVRKNFEACKDEIEDLQRKMQMRPGRARDAKQGVDFTNLQDFLEDQINGRMFDTSFTITVTATDPGTILLHNIMLTAPAQLTIICQAQVGMNFYISNVRGSAIAVQADTALHLCDNLLVLGCDSFSLAGTVDMTNASFMACHAVLFAHGIAIANLNVENGATFVLTEAPFAIGSCQLNSATIIIAAGAQLSLATIQQGWDSAGIVIDNRPNSPLGTVQAPLPKPPTVGTVVLKAINGSMQWTA